MQVDLSQETTVGQQATRQLTVAFTGAQFNSDTVAVFAVLPQELD